MYRSGKEGILVVWGILSSGEKILLSMMLGNKERYEDWLEVFRGLQKERVRRIGVRNNGWSARPY